MRGLFKGLIYGFSSLCLIAQADVADYKLASWNMQGAQSGYGSNSKWVTGVKAIFSRDGIDIVALQESGAVPSSAIVLPIVAGQHPEIERRMPRSDIQVPVVSLVGGSDTIINPSRRGFQVVWCRNISGMSAAAVAPAIFIFITLIVGEVDRHRESIWRLFPDSEQKRSLSYHR
ncbi:hypothetical protein [Yersinia enterocolitica]|uniref:hypothetical protein n=1 Tax=Yersinia enterocolitica TaxID=630 RepID=UPI001E5C5A19|nr:hypothetical protein [Yersinia enterocolitica]